MEFTVNDDGNGILLRSYLKRLKLSTKLISHLKELSDGITVNGERVTVRYILRSGDVVGLAIEDTIGSEAVVPCELPLSVLYEDNDIIVCNKPPYMPTHPSHGHHDDTLANALAFYYLDKPFVFRPVNRLDRNTSGVVLVAKNARAASILFTEMRNRKIEKTYIAVVDGEFNGSGIIEKSLRRTAESIIVREICPPDADGAQYACTEYSVLTSGGGYSVVSLHPLTGRTHQLRVHLASLGHPITGDGLYGDESALIGRQALHAHTLSFSRPSDGKTITVTAPIPEDILTVARLTDNSETSSIFK